MYYVTPETPMMSSIIIDDCLDLMPPNILDNSASVVLRHIFHIVYQMTQKCTHSFLNTVLEIFPNKTPLVLSLVYSLKFVFQPLTIKSELSQSRWSHQAVRI